MTGLGKAPEQSPRHASARTTGNGKSASRGIRHLTQFGAADEIRHSVQNSSASVVATGSALHAPDRTALALAEAMIPGSARIPGADEAVVRETRRFLKEMSPTLATVGSAAQGILNAASVLSTGQRLHALDSHAQNSLLERWEQDAILKAPLSLVSLIHLDDPRVVGCGRFDAYFERGLHAWYTAAGSLIVTEAGGRVTSSQDTPHDVYGFDTVASNG